MLSEGLIISQPPAPVPAPPVVAIDNLSTVDAVFGGSTRQRLAKNAWTVAS